MTNVESRKLGLFDKSRREKRDVNIAYQTIGGSKSSLDGCNQANSQDKTNVSTDIYNLNQPVNLKKSKTFKIIVNKKGKEKEKMIYGKEKVKGKSKKRKVSEVVTENPKLDLMKEYELKRPLFGTPLNDACKHSKSHDGYPIPAFFRSCINYLEKDNRLSFEGLYRIPGVNSQIVNLRQALHSDTDITKLLSNYDIAVITSIIKAFIRDLKPEIVEKPLEKLLFRALDQFKDCPNEKVLAVKNVLSEKLPEENQYLLALIINHMRKIIDMSHLNKMNLENLLIVLGPTLHMHFEILKFFFDHSSELFYDLQVPVYIPPIRPGPEHEEELPETVDGINEELKKQTSYLDDLHEQINEGLGTERTEYLIWEVQLIVTKLKRKKYIAELNDPELIKNELVKYGRQLEKLRKEMLDVSNSSSSVVGTNAIVSHNDPSSVGTLSSIDNEFWQVQRTWTTLNRKLKSFSGSVRHTNESVVFACNPADDDDDDSVQLNLTLRKPPVDDVVGDCVSSEEEKPTEQVSENCCLNSNEIHVLNNDEFSSTEILPAGEELTVEEKTLEWKVSDSSQVSTENVVENLSIDENHLTTCSIDYERSSSYGLYHTTEEEICSNSESALTGSHVATCIDDLIQTGEMWTNEKEHLIPEDEDIRNDALRLLYMREELISIRNDLKTRLVSESNEMLRLKKNIEDLEEERIQRNFKKQNLYKKLNETSSSAEDGNFVNVEKDDDDDDNDSEESDDDDRDIDDDTDDSDNVQFPEHTMKGRTRLCSTDDIQDISELLKQQQEIIADNERLEKENIDLLEQINQERNHCLELKVALKTHTLVTCPSPFNIEE